jgi:hypothetical protein
VKKIIVATVITLLMLSPAWAADVRFPSGSLLAASKQDDRNNRSGREDQGRKKPPMVIIKGKGGKVTGVEREPEKRRQKKR